MDPEEGARRICRYCMDAQKSGIDYPGLGSGNPATEGFPQGFIIQKSREMQAGSSRPGRWPSELNHPWCPPKRDFGAQKGVKFRNWNKILPTGHRNAINCQGAL